MAGVEMVTSMARWEERNLKRRLGWDSETSVAIGVSSSTSQVAPRQTHPDKASHPCEEENIKQRAGVVGTLIDGYVVEGRGESVGWSSKKKQWEYRAPGALFPKEGDTSNGYEKQVTGGIRNVEG